MTSQSLLVWTPLSAKWNKTIRGQIKFLEQWKRTPVNLQKLWTFSKCSRGMLKKNNLQEKGVRSKFNHKENTEDSPQPFIKLKNNKLNSTKNSLKNLHQFCSSQPVTKRQQCGEVLEPCFMLRSRSSSSSRAGVTHGHAWLPAPPGHVCSRLWNMFHHSIKKGILYIIVLTCPTKLEPIKQLAMLRI